MRHRGGTESPHLNWFTTYAGKPRIEGAWHQLHGQPYLSRSKEYKREVKKKKTYITNNKHRVERLLQGLRNKNMLMFTEPCHHLRLYSDDLHSISDCKAQSRFQQTIAMICIVYGVHPCSNHHPPRHLAPIIAHQRRLRGGIPKGGGTMMGGREDPSEVIMVSQPAFDETMQSRNMDDDRAKPVGIWGAF